MINYDKNFIIRKRNFYSFKSASIHVFNYDQTVYSDESFSCRYLCNDNG